MSNYTLEPYLIALSVRDVDQAVGWYQDHLGFERYKSMDLPDYGMRIAFLEHNGFKLELIEKQNSLPLKERLPDLEDEIFVHGYKKLAFCVQDVEALAARLKAAGVKFLFDVSEDETDPERRVKWCMVTDPDGNWIQFFQKLDV